MSALNIAHQRTSVGYSLGRSATMGVALFDAVPLFRDGLSALVNRTQGLHWVGASRSHRAMSLLQEKYRPDVLMVDSALDPLGHFTRLLTENDARLVVLTLLRESHRTPEFAARMFRRGARGLVPRYAEPAQVVHAIHQTPIARRYVDPAIASLLSDGSEEENSQAGTLTRREFEVLTLIAGGLENRAIAGELFVSVETVRTHIKGMLRKLGARDRAHAVALAYRNGLLLPDTDR